MTGRPFIFVHSSDELYGADRILLDIYESLPPAVRERSVFWLPTDVPHREASLCVELERRGARVEHIGLPVLRRAYRTPRAILALVRRCIRVFLLIRGRRPEFVYCTTSAAFLVAPLARLAGARRVVGHVQELWSGSDVHVLGALARSFHRMIAISGAVRDRLPAPLKDRTVVVLNATSAPSSCEPLRDHDGPVRFLVASRWNAWKGHRTLLAAWDQLDDPGELIVLGGPPVIGESVDVTSLVARLRRPETVRIVGEVGDAHEFINAADAMIIPSDEPEPFGLVAVEAFARARPVVGSRGGGLIEIINHSVDGWLYPIGDADTLARLLASLDRETLASAGEQARVTYERRFTVDRYANDWLAALDLL